MCHGYRIDEREALREFEAEPSEEFVETEPAGEESEEEPPLPTADD